MTTGCTCTNLSKHRTQAEEALLESENKFRCLAEEALVGIYIIQGSFFQYVNPKMAEIFRYGVEELQGKVGPRDLVLPEDWPKVHENIQKRLGNEVLSIHYEFRGVTKAKEIIYIEVFGTRTLIHGAPAVVGTLLDITERKRAEEEIHILNEELQYKIVQLQAAQEELVRTARKQSEEKLRISEEKFSKAFRISPDSININRLSDGLFLEVNEGFLAITGYHPEEVIGKTSVELGIWVNMEDRQYLAHELSQTGIVDNLEAQFRRKDGTIITGLMSARIIELENELCGLSITRDITDRKRAEQSLRESEETLRRMMDSMPAGIMWFDEKGNIEYCNRYFTNCFGYTTDDIQDVREWFERAYPDPDYRNTYMAGRKAAIETARRDGTPVPARESKIISKDGSERHVIISNYLEHNRTLAIFTDITERELINDQLLKVGKLESLGVLAGGIAHDFNNILTGIIGNISLAQMFLDTTHKAYKPLKQAEKASQRATELAGQLLTFAKGGQPIKKVVSLHKLVSESVSLVLRGTNVDGSIDIPTDLHAVEADEGQIHQAFNNILINAVQAMPGGGTLSVKGENVSLEVNNRIGLSPGEYVSIRFKDQGCGIQRKVLKNIFDPYFTTKTGGTGLGLASTHSIIMKHNGQILAKSEVGKGTIVTIYLPSIGEMYQEFSSEDARDIGIHAGHYILVMDDDEMIRDLATEILKEFGCRVETCVNGDETISLYKTAKEAGDPFSCVLMDLTIPGGMGGKETMRKLLEIDPSAVGIVSSGYSNDPILANYRDYGFSGVVTKPYNTEELGSVLHGLLSQA
jgi:PAS domain S-box-containing protein